MSSLGAPTSITRPFAIATTRGTGGASSTASAGARRRAVADRRRGPPIDATRDDARTSRPRAWARRREARAAGVARSRTRATTRRERRSVQRAKGVSPRASKTIRRSVTRSRSPSTPSPQFRETGGGGDVARDARGVSRASPPARTQRRQHHRRGRRLVGLGVVALSSARPRRRARRRRPLLRTPHRSRRARLRRRRHPGGVSPDGLFLVRRRRPTGAHDFAAVLTELAPFSGPAARAWR